MAYSLAELEIQRDGVMKRIRSLQRIKSFTLGGQPFSVENEVKRLEAQLKHITQQIQEKKR